MEDKYTDRAIAELVKDIHADLERISRATEEIRNALVMMTTPPPRVIPQTTTTVPQFRSGRWIVRDGIFPDGTSGITHQD
jgi:hypothetical protein